MAWSPLFAATFDDLEAKISGGRSGAVRIGGSSALVLRAPDVEIKSLDLQRGALVVDGVAGAAITVDGLNVE